MSEEEDFKALLARTEKHAASSTDTQNLNLDNITREKLDVDPASPKTHGGRTSGNSVFAIVKALTMHFAERLSSYMTMLCYFYPCMCGTILFFVIGLVLWGFATLIFNPRVEYGVMKHDHSFLDSKYNLKVGDIDHWCLRGDDNSCRCEDPLVPTSRADRKSWRLAFKTNRKIVKAVQEADGLDLDMVFVGESVVEEMDGRWMGQGGRSPSLQKLAEQFHSRFSRDKGGKFNAIALGIAGDTAPNVLWRLLHGEMTPEVNPKIWWLSLGMNDLARMQCSEEVVVMGILRVVEELLEAKPTAHVVINSLFPMSMIRGGLYPKITDFKDSFRKPHPTGILKARAHTPARTTDERLQVPRSNVANNNNRFLRKHSGGGAPRVPQTEEEAADAEDRAREKGKMKVVKVAPKNWKAKRVEKRKENKVNPILTEKHKIRKHISDVSLPIWTSVQVVNRQLRKFAANNPDRVTFFDTTKYFASRVGGGNQMMLLTDMISIRGHPTAKGFEVWEDAIAEKASKIMDDLRKNSPELFSTPSDGGSNTEGNAESNNGGFSMNDVIDFDNFAADDDFADDAFAPYDDDYAMMQDGGNYDGANNSGNPPENKDGQGN
mmetsp:Transcript_10751/g.29654  ORF Transcript_10751/g.29654 Transcript_10751/m.29654 type:complete len:605 (-) Transcript_10751:57-1871(-)